MGETLYAQVARDLTEGIASGRFPVGSTLPTEMELCAHYGASRHTVRSAIRELQELGLVTRNKKAGTRVEAPAEACGYRQPLTSVEDLIQFGAAHVREVRAVAEVEVAPALAARLGCRPGSRWLRISSVRRDRAPEVPPIGWTDVYLDPAYSGIAETVRASPEILVSTLVEQRYGRRIAEIRQDVQAVLLPDDMARRLASEAGAPALRVLRRYLDAAGQASSSRTRSTPPTASPSRSACVGPGRPPPDGSAGGSGVRSRRPMIPLTRPRDRSARAARPHRRPFPPARAGSYTRSSQESLGSNANPLSRTGEGTRRANRNSFVDAVYRVGRPGTPASEVGRRDPGRAATRFHRGAVPDHRGMLDLSKP